MLRLLVAAVSIAAAFAVPAYVDLDGLGRVRGVALDHSRYFKGIPYAAPPVRERRWAQPAPVAAWSPQVWDATDFRPSCLQGPFDPPITNKSEDCLYLNVYAPPEGAPGSGKWPVMLWYHGGGYTGGGGNESRLNGTWPVELFGDVVIVTINYRLNVFGFLGSEILRNRDPGHTTGNWGFQDQRAALLWVRQHIGKFGGDPSNTMIYGESAGAGSVSNHLVAPKSIGLYTKAIMQSGSFSSWIVQTAAQAATKYDAILKAVNCTSLDCLLSTPADVIETSGQKFGWAPTIDGVELPDFPWVLLDKGNHAKVPIIVGSVRDEGSSFSNLPHQLSQTEFTSFLQRTYGPYAPQVQQLYDPKDYPNTPCCNNFYWAGAHTVGDSIMTCPAHHTASVFSKLGSWLYLFAHPPQNNPGNEFAYHSCDIAYVFRALNLMANDQEKELATKTAKYWRNFAHNNNPNSPDLPQWPQYDPTTDLSLWLDYNITVHAKDRNPQCAFWNSIFPNGTMPPVASQLPFWN